MVLDIELQKRIEEFEKEIESIVAMQLFMRNSSYFIEQWERLNPPWKFFRGVNNES